MRNFVLCMFLAVMANACAGFGETYQLVEARFVITNGSQTPQVFSINSVEFLVPGGGQPEVIVKIPIPDNPYGVTNPTAFDKATRVPIGVKNTNGSGGFIATGECYSGAKVRSLILYRPQFNQLSCS